MTNNQASTIRRLFGDSAIIKDNFDNILLLHKMSMSSGDEDADSIDPAIMFLLRKIVEKCDLIATEIEKGFGNEIR